MSIPTNLPETSLALQHSVAVGQAMEGKIPADDDPAFAQSRAIITYEEPADGVMGLFDLASLFTERQTRPFLTGMQIICGSTVTWQLFVTCGDADRGTVDTGEYNDPAYDVELASGTGPAYIKPNVELLPGQALRVLADTAAAVPTIATVLLANTIGGGGRLLG